MIDADGCPVVDIAVKIAAERKVDCIILCDTSHVFEKAGAKTVTVSKGADSVDFALVNKQYGEWCTPLAAGLDECKTWLAVVADCFHYP